MCLNCREFRVGTGNKYKRVLIQVTVSDSLFGMVSSYNFIVIV